MTLADAHKSNIIKMSDHRKTPRAVLERNPVFTVTLTLEGVPHAQCRNLTAHEAARHTVTLRNVLLAGYLKDYPEALETSAVNVNDKRGKTTHYILSHRELKKGEIATVLAKIEVEVQYD